MGVPVDSRPKPGAAERPPTGLLLDPIYKQHRTYYDHIECPERLDIVARGLAEADLTRRLAPIGPRLATEDELRLCHTPEYVALVRRETEAGAFVLSTGDTPLGGRSCEVARYAVGGTLNAVDAAIAGTVRNAFCAVRPPGHHAGPDRGSGFCIFNNVAVAARYARRRHGIERVLIVDWDVHHGNGTQDIFYEDGTVLYFGLHQWPWYPGSGAAEETGAGAGLGATINIPLPPGSGGRECRRALAEQLEPAAERFRPEFVLVSAGFDSRAGAWLGRLTLTDEDFAEMTRRVMNLAETYADGRLVSVLEGGYEPDGLASASAAHVGALMRTQ
jgi:acetoin utilization deacetylase AcuC-like enzyme